MKKKVKKSTDKRSTRKLSPRMQNKIEEALRRGEPKAEIARRLGVSTSSVYRLSDHVDVFNREGLVTKKPFTGSLSHHSAHRSRAIT